jgi:hypothetical protein
MTGANQTAQYRDNWQDERNSAGLYSGFRQVIFGLLAAGITFGLGRVIGASLAG